MWPTGALDAPERLTPRKITLLPALSTKLQAVVWRYSGGVGCPVAGDIDGTRGITEKSKQEGEEEVSVEKRVVPCYAEELPGGLQCPPR